MNYEQADWSMVSLNCSETLRDYIEHGIRTGGFLECVLAGDLFTAATKADLGNRRALGSIALFLVWYAPKACYGSQEKVEAWIARGGLRGRLASRADAPVKRAPTPEVSIHAVGLDSEVVDFLEGDLDRVNAIVRGWMTLHDRVEAWGRDEK